MFTADSYACGYIYQAVLAPVDGIKIFFFSLTGKDCVALAAALRRQWMGSMKTSTDILPSGGNNDVSFQIKNSGDQPRESGKAFT